MQSSLLALINFAAMLLVCSFLAQALAQQHWRRGNSASAIVLILLCGQVWLLPQAISLFAMHSSRLLYFLWFGNWIALAAGVILFNLMLRGSSRDLFDAARVDGAGSFALYRHVVWPTMSKPLVALAILLIMATWVEFAGAWSGFAAFRLDQLTIPNTNQGMAIMIAASLLATFPIIAIYFFARQFRRLDPRSTG
jgi:ABC-type glycerol-3-phosphate transport system permease component